MICKFRCVVCHVSNRALQSGLQAGGVLLLDGSWASINALVFSDHGATVVIADIQICPQAVEDATCALANLKGVALKASHIAEAALFLASERSEFISGHDLVVDGGFNHLKAISRARQ
ncbi:short-chain dehydrogenase reductase 3a-like [Asparagus officinalis]|uniref:short-chain dehydrogenase reductase 3a-like n=1 Tax=Asparagus officinalis TaxID=4686 RepID=UPI00098E3DF8|nr:short-chain dehydrogenase reductase 3a-like [Asparagus officinalis]